MSKPCRVDVSKTRDYLLDPDHESGGPKSAFFEAHGFRRARHEELADALIRHFNENEISDDIATSFGTKLIVQGHLVTPDGRGPFVRSVWIRSIEDGIAAFVTAFPR